MDQKSLQKVVFFSQGLQVLDPTKVTTHTVHPSGDLGSLAGWELKADIEAKIDADTAGADIKSYYKAKWSDVNYFQKIRQQWKNPDLVF